MDFFTVLIVLIIVYWSSSLAVMCLTDSDMMTFLSIYFGKAPEDVFKGKVVWVTGASSGIGEGLAKYLAKCNAKIVLSARRVEELQRVKQACLSLNSKLTDKDILILPFDMTDYTAHETSFKQILKHFGKLDVLISNAGRSQRAAWHDIELEVDRELFELNVFSLLNLNRIVVRHFLEKGSGHLAVTSSIGGKIGIPFSGSYTASKHAIHGYFESLRNETRGKGIDITMLCPGPVFSELLKVAFTDKKGQQFQQEMKTTDRRMTAERCGYLCLVGMANKLDESWMAPFPIVLLTYISTCFPYFASKMMTVLARFGIFAKLRDSRDALKED